MKVLGYIAVIIGFVIIAGTAGSADFYDKCRAAVDCVAGEPMSLLQVIAQFIGGLILMVGGSIWAWIWSE